MRSSCGYRATERGAQRRVDRVDRSVALCGVHVALLDPGTIGRPHLDRRLRGEAVGRVLVGDDAHALDAEELLLPPGGTAHQQLQGRVGRLEVVALVLQALEVVDHLVDRRTVERQAELLRLDLDRRPPGHLAHDEAGAVADQLRVDVLVGVLGPLDRTDVQAGLVGERRGADVRRLRVERPVEHLGDVVADRGEPLDAPLRQALQPDLELQVGDHRGEVAVAGPFAEPVQRALHLASAGAHRGHRVGHRAAGVVMAVDADDHVVADVAVDLADDLLDLVGQRAAVGVAQHDVRRAVDAPTLRGRAARTPGCA